MPRTNRNTLKEYFKRGSMPNQKHFYELIDSMVNISDDGIDKNPDDGLRLAPSKENSPVISLFTNIQDNIPEWKIYLGNNSQLHIIRQGQDEPILSLHPNGRIEMNNPVWIYVSTAVFPQPASTVRYGVNFPQMANGIPCKYQRKDVVPTASWLDAVS